MPNVPQRSSIPLTPPGYDAFADTVRETVRKTVARDFAVAAAWYLCPDGVEIAVTFAMDGLAFDKCVRAAAQLCGCDGSDCGAPEEPYA